MSECQHRTTKTSWVLGADRRIRSRGRRSPGIKKKERNGRRLGKSTELHVRLVTLRISIARNETGSLGNVHFTAQSREKRSKLMTNTLSTLIFQEITLTIEYWISWASRGGYSFGQRRSLTTFTTQCMLVVLVYAIVTLKTYLTSMQLNLCNVRDLRRCENSLNYWIFLNIEYEFYT